MPLLLLVALARRRLLARAAVLPLILAILSIPACVILVGKAEVSSVDASTPVTLTTPVKAHLRDGSTVLYRRGVTVTAESLAGPGTRYGLTLADSAPVTAGGDRRRRNPDGPFATDNRALPFARAGLAPEAAQAPALRALALAYGAVPFYAEAAARVSDPGDVRHEEITRLLDGAAARARTAIAAHPAGLPRTELATLWVDVWEEIAALEPRAAYARDLGFAAEQP